MLLSLVYRVFALLSPAPTLDLLSLGVRDLQQCLSNGTITSVQLVEQYLDNIAANNHAGLKLRAVIETAPREDVLAIAQHLDDMRANGTILSELHGIPMLFKDNIDTDVSLGMNTTSGAYAFLGSQVPGDAPVTASLRAKGVIVIGKANLGELSDSKGNITNGWSARGGQTQSAYVVGGFAAGGDPCTSSSGSAVGVSAGFAAASLGSDTDGSLGCPANRAALYTIRTTVGLSSRTGVIPISLGHDVLGPMAKSAYDVALILENMVGYDPEDEWTAAARSHTHSNYTQFALSTSFKGRTLAVPRAFYNETSSGNDPAINKAMEKALEALRSSGATIVDPAEMPSAEEVPLTGPNKIILVGTDFKADLATYLARRSNPQVHTLEDLINWNDKNRHLEFDEQCCQEALIRSVQFGHKNATAYRDAQERNWDIGRTRGIDYTLHHHSADAIVVPSEGWAFRLASISGYPMATVPLGQLESGQPFGLSFIGRQWSEPVLISLMAAWEAVSPPRAIPKQLV